MKKQDKPAFLCLLHPPLTEVSVAPKRFKSVAKRQKQVRLPPLPRARSHVHTCEHHLLKQVTSQNALYIRRATQKVA